MSQVTLEVGYILLAPLSVIGSGLLLWTHLKIAQLRRHPGILVLMQCLTQCIVDLHWFTSIPWVEESLKGVPCVLIGALSCYFYFASWNYTLALSSEVFSMIRNPFRANSKFRNTLYHSLCLGVPVPVFVLLVVYGETDQNSVKPACYLATDLIVGLLIWFLLIVHVPVSLLVVAYSILKVWGQSVSSEMIYHALVVLGFNISWLPFSIWNGLSYFYQVPDWIANTALVLACSSGFIVFCARLIEPSMHRQLFGFICKKQPKNLVEDSFESLSLFENFLEEGTSFYSKFFEKLVSNNVFNTLYGLTFLLRNKKSQEECISAEGNFTLWKFKVFVEKKLQFRVKEYYPESFQRLRATLGLSDLNLIESLNIESNAKDLDYRSKNPGGRGESFFYFTADNKYILKTLTSEEMKLLKWMLPVYLNRLCSKKSFLAKILALYSIKINSCSSFYVMLMENLLSKAKSPLVFDLKGSSVDRQATQESFGDLEDMPREVVYKDTDFINNAGTLEVPQEEVQAILKVVTEDTLMLQSFGIMDYSFLVGIEFCQDFPRGTTYYFGIIDYLQKYNSGKRLETTFKKLKGPGISSVPPIPYRERFLKFVKDIFKPKLN